MSSENNNQKISINALLEKFPNRFFLSSALSKRARQIAEGEKVLIDIEDDGYVDPIFIAIKEFEAGFISASLMEAVDDEVELLEKLDKSLDEKLEDKEEKESGSKTKEKESKRSKSKSL
ncbi:hypothetical protein DID78_02625 [Candidatus Marinamargulisbacteria bacterium SCGC AG-343-D04]|nr:hypothetical protein DID78_02625 [Candidatus Marinamargulisbacteria bacterium SCGC AG-343-D04]